MHDQKRGKYVFDRKVSMPDELLQDVQPYPMPTRMFAEHGDEILKGPKRKMWKDHLTLSIGSDLQGASFHRHNAAWNTIVYGAKRWVLYDYRRYEKNTTMLHRMAGYKVLTTPDWIRKMYTSKERIREIRHHGHDCVQHAGDMLYVPRQWAHM